MIILFWGNVIRRCILIPKITTSPFSLDATEQAALVKAGLLSPVELLDASLRQTARLNPKINASASEAPGLAQKRTQTVASCTFGGVPTLVKVPLA